ncbi:MAG: polysaccharide deacetylase family protein [Treponema sp.]|nr:polysaccharide deacetylase family protein [Treponema sp.]
MKKIIIMTAGVLMASIIGGCANTGNNYENAEQAAYRFLTKTEIEEYIAANWRDYGYSEKPAKYIAISFDDGPCDSSAYGGTKAMLAALKKAKVKATFFVIGGNVHSNRSAAQAIFDEGHELGNHSNGYGSLGSASIEAITSSLNATSNIIREITGSNPRLFRAPNLNHGENLSQVCKNLGMALIDGSVHNDWPGSSPAVKNSVLAYPRDGDIILLHDNNTSQGNTMKDLPEIIANLRAKGFWIMTISELAIIKSKTLEAGTRYGAL